MATRVYESDIVYLIDGTQIYITPLKLKYLRPFMDLFEKIVKTDNEEDSLDQTIECVRVAMEQYYPDLKTFDDIQDNLDMPTIQRILEIAAGAKKKEDVTEDSEDDSEGMWDSLDLARLEAEVFLLGIWKDYEELEESLSMPELTATLNAKRDSEYQDKKFFAAIKGIDLDKQSGKDDPWERMKAKVFSGGRASGSDDVLALQGANAAKAGFGIGMGLDYENVGKK
jgi:hypothetical protein